MLFQSADAARAQEMIWRVASPKRAEMSAAFFVENTGNIHLDGGMRINYFQLVTNYFCYF